MPVYTYEMDNGYRFEIEQKFTDPALTTIRDADGETRPIRRVITPFNAQFKGTGWARK